MLEDTEELIEDEGENTGQDVPVVKTLVIVVVAVLVTVCDIWSVIDQKIHMSTRLTVPR